MLASGVAELVSLGAVLPFLAVLSDPERLWQQPLVNALFSRAGFTGGRELLIPATLAFAAAAVLAALIRLANLWLNGRLAAAVGSDLSCEAYRRTLYQPYRMHVQRNSAGVITGTTTQIGGTVAALTALLQLVTAAVVALGLLAGLLLIDWAVALGASALFASVYGLLAITTRRELQRNSQWIAAAAKQQIKALQEGLGAIRDVLLDGNQPTYVAIYRQADRPQRQLQAKNQFLGAFPRYAMEALGMVAIALMGGLLVLQKGTGGATIPLLGALALGAQRLLPSLQQVYSGWAVLKGANANIAAVLAMLNQPLEPIVRVNEPMPLRAGIRLEGVHFRYGPGQPEVLRGVELEIRRGERIGLIGTTGSGKSTTVDLLMGLLEPTCGRVLVDGADLHDPAHPERLAAWRAAIAHVPQSIYLADTSVAENIAFGVARQRIDLARVQQAGEQAQIASFIEASPEGYGSLVGERGIRLSGGQRQRIGIARALYKQARVLVLDEATSALDTDTEQALIDAVNALSEELTIVMIAHRLTTVQRCDRVIRLEQGTVVDDGVPEQVLARERSTRRQ
ncbi:ABC transporter ATP-binding protein [Cyanobium sp. FACHB-13342]|uniref:ABC transporter ATP-binding protein n=1 Tax=Cyanobium sp. FACHB-13342 TaxID=2692793 RepID=UPI001F558FD0|nr:ABC transporter ATP-binding protein [Cyanobium sp. FACHB-13342]